MNTASLIDNITYQQNEKPTVTVLLKTDNTKEVRIVMKKGQFMKEHKAPFPIIIEMFEGEIDFGVNGKKQILKKGDMIARNPKDHNDQWLVAKKYFKDNFSRIRSIYRNSANGQTCTKAYALANPDTTTKEVV